jgi:hypothetical protein
LVHLILYKSSRSPLVTNALEASLEAQLVDLSLRPVTWDEKVTRSQAFPQNFACDPRLSMLGNDPQRFRDSSTTEETRRPRGPCRARPNSETIIIRRAIGAAAHREPGSEAPRSNDSATLAGVLDRSRRVLPAQELPLRRK